MIRDRKAGGERGKVTETCPAPSAVAVRRTSAPAGKVTTFQRQTIRGDFVTSILVSLLIVELSPRLRSRRTLSEPSAATMKAYFGLPQLWPCQPSGMPVRPC